MENESNFVEDNNKEINLRVRDIDSLIKEGSTENANITQNPETIHKHIADTVMEEYALKHVLPSHLAKAHTSGDIHIHDLSYFMDRPLNCMQHDIRVFIRQGLSVDGTGEHTSIAGAPKHLESLMNHTGEIMLAAQQNMSGGQGMSLWNVFVAPFARGRSYDEIKQAVQMLVYNLNMAYASRGSQVPFTSMSFEFGVPDFLKEVTAYGSGGRIVGTYGDFEEETRLIQRAFTETLLEGDNEGKPHLFPNTIYTLRPEIMTSEYEDDLRLVHELSAKYGSSYFVNMFPEYRGDMANYMGCVVGETGIWCKINDKITYKTFEELSNLFNADYGVTPIHNIEVLTLDDDRNVVWSKATKFIKNKDQQLYKITLSGNKSFICDAGHGMITYTGLNKKPILECKPSTNLIDVSCKKVNLDFDVNYLAVLTGFYLGDGLKSTDYARIEVAKTDKKEYVQHILDELGIDYNYTYRTRPIDERHSNPDIHTFTFKKSIVDINNLDLNDVNTCAGLLSGLLSSDGYIRKTGKYTKSLGAEFVSTDMSISRLFKYCCFMTGLKFSSSLKQGKNHSDHERVYISCNASTIHTLKQLVLRENQEIIVNEFTEDMFRTIKPYKGQRVKSIEKIDLIDDTYCFEVNGRMIIDSDFILTSQCRTSLNDNWTGDWEKDCLRTGNLAYVTLNLPRIGYQSKDENQVFEYLDEYMDLAIETLMLRREQALKCLNDFHILPFLKQRIAEDSYYRIQNSTLSFGFVGLNEMLLSLFGEGIENPEANKFGVKCLEYINQRTRELKEETGLRWSVIQTPAESTVYRFATLDKKQFGDQAIVQGGDGNANYYTNSSHVPVDTRLSLIEKIKIEEQYHSLTPGGHIFNAYLGESYADPDSLMSLTNKIARKSDIGFWAYSSAFSFCLKCKTLMKGLNNQCPSCGEKEDVEWYDRITGYIQQVGHAKSASGGWNPGKRQELMDRRRYEL